MEQGEQKNARTRDGEDYYLWTGSGYYTDESTVPGATHIRPLQDQENSKFQHRGRKGPPAPQWPTSEELMAADGC